MRCIKVRSALFATRPGSQIMRHSHADHFSVVVMQRGHCGSVARVDRESQDGFTIGHIIFVRRAQGQDATQTILASPRRCEMSSRLSFPERSSSKWLRFSASCQCIDADGSSFPYLCVFFLSPRTVSSPRSSLSTKPPSRAAA
jgi:hypothetical protein